MLHLRTLAALLLCALSACATGKQAEPRFGSYTGKDARNALITLASTQLSGGEHVPWHGPFYVYDSTYWVDGESNSDNQSSAIDCRGAHVAWFAIVMANTSTPVGGFLVQASYDGSNSWMPLYLDENRVYGENFSTFSGGTEIGVSSPAGTVTIYLAIENPPPYLRLAYDFDSGGAADTVDAYSLIRGM